MNLLSAAPAWLLIVFACAMLAAAVEDALRLRISNITTLVVLAGAVAAALIDGPTWSLWQNGLAFLVLLLLGTAAFAGGWLGGGDVKLLAVTALWFDLRAAVWFVAMVFLSGGIVAIAYLVARPFRKSPLDKRSRRIPYGIAIAVGAALVVLLNPATLHHFQRPTPAYRILPPRS